METINLETIHNDLELIKKAVADIRLNMVDVDMILSGSDKIAIDEYQKDKASNRLISHNEIKNSIGL